MTPVIGQPITVNAGKATGVLLTGNIYDPTLTQAWPLLYFADATSGKTWSSVGMSIWNLN